MSFPRQRSRVPLGLRNGTSNKTSFQVGREREFDARDLKLLARQEWRE
jgi:hypothetical protein